MTEFDYGILVVKSGKYAGRICYYDDDIWDDDLEIEVAVVYFGEMSQCRKYFFIPFTCLAYPTTEDLKNRRNQLRNSIGLIEPKHLRNYEITELHLIESTLYEWLLSARYQEVEQGKKVFISHSSKDKDFVRWLSSDLSNAGHTPWLDEWQIKVGDSIPEKIESGLDDADAIILVLSQNAVESKWVEREWHSMYWDEIESGNIMVLPILYQDCKIPRLLKMKKYANFIQDYNSGLEDVLLALK